MTQGRGAIEAAIIQDFRVYAEAVAKAYTDALVTSFQAELRTTVSELAAARDGTQAAARAIKGDVERAASDFKSASAEAVLDVQLLGTRLDEVVHGLERSTQTLAEEFKQQIQAHANTVSAAPVRELEAARTALTRYGDAQTAHLTQATAALADDVRSELAHAQRTRRITLAIALVQAAMLGVVLWRVLG